MVRQWCASCGIEMRRRDDGAWHSCCGNLGYWADVAPLPQDRWWPVTHKDGRWFYPTAKWIAERTHNALLEPRHE